MFCVCAFCHFRVGRYFERAPVEVSQDISDDGTTLSTMSEDEDPENVRWTRFALDLEDQELPRFVIHPNSRFRTIFDIVVAMAITYNALVLPFRVCFNVDANGWLLALEVGGNGGWGVDKRDKVWGAAPRKEIGGGVWHAGASSKRHT